MWNCLIFLNDEPPACQQASKRANKQSGRQATHVQRVHRLIFFRLNDSHLIFVERSQFCFEAVCLHHIQSFSDGVVHWSLLLVIANHTQISSTQFEKWNQQSTLLAWFKANLFIDERLYPYPYTFVSSYTCQLNQTAKKKNLVKNFREFVL